MGGRATARPGSTWLVRLIAAGRTERSQNRVAWSGVVCCAAMPTIFTKGDILHTHGLRTYATVATASRDGRRRGGRLQEEVAADVRGVSCALRRWPFSVG